MDDEFVHLLVAVGLGLLVGFQRERKEDALAGFRTFPLITVAGALAWQLVESPTPLLAAGLVSVAALAVAGNVARWRQERGGLGLTTEIAALVMFLVGATAGSGRVAEAIVVGGGVALLLYLKEPLHGWAERMADADVSAVMRLVLIALVILPILPDETYGPYDVLNPFQIWMVVVLIVGISLASYVLYRIWGARAGTLLGGVLGGLISSTATTASHARRARHDTALAPPAAVAIMLASTVVFARVLAEVGAVAPRVLPTIAPPLVALGLVHVVLCGVGYRWIGEKTPQLPEQEDPTELKAALVFGLLYGVVIFAVAAAREHLGDAGIYAVALVSGLTDVDAITLSVANLLDAERLEAGSAWRAILLAVLANLVFKGGMAGALGGPALLARVAWLFVPALVAGGLIIWLWP